MPRGMVSAPPSRAQAHYRESHASRLRQQLRGMSNTGPFGPPRSKSSSPTKLSRRSLTSDNYLPYSRTSSPDKAVDLIQTPHTLSDSSSMRSLNKDTQDILRVITNPPSCCTFDSQSKTMSKVHGPGSTASRHSATSIADSKASNQHSCSSKQRSGYKLTPASDRSKTTNKSRGSTSTSRNSTASIDDSRSSTGTRNKTSSIVVTTDNEQAKPTNKPNNVISNKTVKQSVGSFDGVRSTNRVKSGCVITAANFSSEIGYGKPLVTPVDKRLTIRRDIMQLSQAGSDKPDKYAPVCQKKRSPIRPWRAANSVDPLSKPASVYSKSNAGGTQPSSKSAGNKLRASLTNTNVKADCPAAKNIGAASVPRPMSSLSKRASNSSSKSSVVSGGAVSSKCLLPLRSNPKGSPNTINHVKDSTRSPRKVENASKPIRDIKQISVRTSANSQGSKVYKPQLEDIKSSFLLLNKTTKARIDGRKASPIPKPQPYSESERKAILLESKTKFKSKDFWNDAKYDRIEGLNWISWK